MLRLVKHLNARAREAYVSEHGVARVFIGRQDAPSPPMRAHANIARAYAALGKDGRDQRNTLRLHVATACGLADGSLLSSDTTAQELPMGYPNAPGSVRGWAERCGRALAQRKTPGVLGVEAACAQGQTILKSGKAHHLFAQSQQAKRQVLTRLLTEVGPLLVQTRPLIVPLRQRHGHGTHRATATLCTLPEVAKRLIPPMVQWSTTGGVAPGQMLPAGLPTRVHSGATRQGKRWSVACRIS